MNDKGAKILVTGATGFLGKNLFQELKRQGYENIVGVGKKDFDLTEQGQVRKMLSQHHPTIVIHLAGLVGGILANKERPGEFFYENLMMGTMVFHEAFRSGVRKYMTCIGGCGYPANAPSPIGEESLWNGYPQPESAPYSMAKNMSVLQSHSYRRQYGFNSIVLVPGNLYGPFDNHNLSNAHVVPALIRKAYEAKTKGDREFVVWGSGKPIRDFVYVEDVARAIIHAMQHYDQSDIINISSGQETTIRELVELITSVFGFEGRVVWDRSKPDGQMRKGFDVTKMRSVLGFECSTSLKDGLQKTISWFTQNYPDGVRL